MQELNGRPGLGLGEVLLPQRGNQDIVILAIQAEQMLQFHAGEEPDVRKLAVGEAIE